MLGYIILVCVFFPYYIGCTSIIPPESQTNTYKIGGSLSLEWRYSVDQNREFLRVECGKRIDGSLSVSNDGVDSLEVFLEFANQNIQIIQQNYAQITASVENRIIKIDFNDIKKTASGEFKCILSVFNKRNSNVEKLQSKAIRLITEGEFAANQAEKENNNIIIIGVVATVVVLTIIIVVVVCLICRYKKGKKPLCCCCCPCCATSSRAINEDEKGTVKKDGVLLKTSAGKKHRVTKDDIKFGRVGRYEDENLNETYDSQAESKKMMNDREPKYAEVEIVSTPDQALNRPYYDDNSSMKDYV